MQAHRYPPFTKTNLDPDGSPRWLPVLTALTSVAGLIGAVWVAVQMLF